MGCSPNNGLQGALVLSHKPAHYPGLGRGLKLCKIPSTYRRFSLLRAHSLGEVGLSYPSPTLVMLLSARESKRSRDISSDIRSPDQDKGANTSDAPQIH